jgi:integrase
MGSIYQIKSGKYKGQWRGNANLPKKWDDEKQKWVYPKKTIYAKDAPEARRLVNEIENQVFKRKYVDSGNLTVRQYLLDWIDPYCDSEKIADTTRELYHMYINVHINPSIGHIKMRDILPIDINKFYNKLRKGGYTYKDKSGKVKIRQPLMEKTIGKIHTILNRAFKDAVINKLLYDNPCDGVKTPKKEKYTPNVYNEEQINKLLSIVEGTFDEVCIVLASFMSFRRGEVFGIRTLKDIHFETNKIDIIKTKTRFTGDWKIKDPKSETSKRTNKAPQFVMDIIKRYIDSLPVIPERLCDKFQPGSYSKHFKALLEKNNLPPIRYHDLRHFTGSILAKYNIPKPLIKDYMGHADESTTSIYTHTLSDMTDMTVEVMEKVYYKK